MLEESLRGGHPTGPIRSGGCSSQSLAAWASRRPRARCSSSSLPPPQDRENCHAGGNAFVLFDGFKPVALCNLCVVKSNEVSFSFAERTTESVWVGAAPAGDFGPPRPWRSVCTRPRAINIASLGCFTEVAVQHLFQPASALLSACLSIFRAGTATQYPA